MKPTSGTARSTRQFCYQQPHHGGRLAGGRRRQHFRRLVIGCLASTAALGLAFMVVKGFEYKEDIDKHLVPGAQFALHGNGRPVVLRILLARHRRACHPPHHRHRPGDPAGAAGLPQEASARQNPGDRGHGIILAPRRYHLDISLSPDLPAGTGLMSAESSEPRHDGREALAPERPDLGRAVAVALAQPRAGLCAHGPVHADGRYCDRVRQSRLLSSCCSWNWRHRRR